MPTPYAESHFHTRNAKAFADEIRQATNGRLDITVHSNGSLFKLSEIKRAVQTGQVPIAEVSLPFYGNEYPFFEMDVVLFLARTLSGGARSSGTSRGNYVEGRLGSQGIGVLFVVPFPGMGMISKNPVNKIEDLKGTKFSAWGPVAVRFGEAVGATPTVVQAPELAQAFMVGIVDNTLASASTAVATSGWDYAKYFIELRAAHAKDYFIVNQAAFKALPQDIQEIVLKAAATAEKRGWEWSEKEHEDNKATLRSKGMNVIEPDPEFLAGLRQIGDRLAADWEKKAGADGTAALEGIPPVNDIRRGAPGARSLLQRMRRSGGPQPDRHRGIRDAADRRPADRRGLHLDAGVRRLCDGVAVVPRPRLHVQLGRPDPRRHADERAAVERQALARRPLPA